MPLGFSFNEAFDYGAAHHAGADNCDFAGHNCSLAARLIGFAL